MNNKMVIDFVNRLAVDESLREKLESDFEGTLAANEVSVTSRELASLKASWRFIKEVNPMELEARFVADGDGGGDC
jgi:hypothetical protein